MALEGKEGGSSGKSVSIQLEMHGNPVTWMQYQYRTGASIRLCANNILGLFSETYLSAL